MAFFFGSVGKCLLCLHQNINELTSSSVFECNFECKLEDDAGRREISPGRSCVYQRILCALWWNISIVSSLNHATSCMDMIFDELKWLAFNLKVEPKTRLGCTEEKKTSRFLNIRYLLIACHFY